MKVIWPILFLSSLAQNETNELHCVFSVAKVSGPYKPFSNEKKDLALKNCQNSSNKNCEDLELPTPILGRIERRLEEKKGTGPQENEENYEEIFENVSENIGMFPDGGDILDSGEDALVEEKVKNEIISRIDPHYHLKVEMSCLTFHERSLSKHTIKMNCKPHINTVTMSTIGMVHSFDQAFPLGERIKNENVVYKNNFQYVFPINSLPPKITTHEPSCSFVFKGIKVVVSTMTLLTLLSFI